MTKEEIKDLAKEDYDYLRGQKLVEAVDNKIDEMDGEIGDDIFVLLHQARFEWEDKQEMFDKYETLFEWLEMDKEQFEKDFYKFLEER